MNKRRKTQIKLDEINFREDELLFEQLFLGANTTLSATIILFLFFFPYISDPPPPLLEGILHHIVSF